VGENFALGRGRAGSVPRLREIGASLGFAVEPVPLRLGLGSLGLPPVEDRQRRGNVRAAGPQAAGPPAAGSRVLNLFAYTGAFALQAVAGGAAEAVSVESSRGALATAREAVRLNPHLPADRFQWVEGDALEYLAADRTGAGSSLFDLLIVDPPPFARRRSDLPGALKAYAQVNRLAFARTAPGGLVLTFSCSSAVSSELFTGALTDAARQAGRELQLLQALHSAPDHPVAAAHPEGEYLKGWLLRVL
jgi:23S rRNA (cytosine1962-C5)-methyltransferase